MQSLYIIDASGYLYRSYFAIRNMTNSQGESTNALYGFARSLLKLEKDFHPTHIVAVFDGPHGGKKREAIYPNYKAHRNATPPDLIYQIEWAKQLCELMGIPHLNIPEVEADDTMGSVAVWAEKIAQKVYLCTSDKDLCQFVNNRVFILNTHKENLILGASEVEAFHGVPPSQMIDYLAITGDSSDNIPGLSGFGPKTAVALLKEHGSLEFILEHPDVVSGKKRETIIQQAETARLSKKLVTIDTQVEFPQSEHYFKIKSVEINPLKDFYAKMNFNTLIRELDQGIHFGANATESPKISSESVTYTLVDDEHALNELLQNLSRQKEVCFDIETTNEHPLKADLVGIGFAFEPTKAWYIPANGKIGQKRLLEALKELFENSKIGFYSHHVKYSYEVLSNYQITPAHICFDSMLASYLLNSHSHRHGLDYLILELLGKVKIPPSDLLGKGKKEINMGQVPIEKVSHFCCEDVDYMCRLKALLQTSLEERHLTPLLTDLELPLLPVLAAMEERGIYLDTHYLQQLSLEITQQIAILEKEIYLLADCQFNLNSPKQLSEVLFTKMGIKPPKKTTTGHSTDAEVLDLLAQNYPIAVKILAYRTLEKLRSTYIDALPKEVYEKTHRIHCSFNQTVAATGRLSCQNPNLQNIPIRSEIGRKIRAAFKPEKENWSYLAADYSQIELRLLAHFSADPKLLEAFQEERDIHAHTASTVLGIALEEVTKEQRQSAKAVNFGILYGQQAYGLAKELGIEVKQAASFIDKYFHGYQRVEQFIEECKEKARATGKTVTYTGRERLIPEIHSKNGMLRAAAERLAVNTPIQGTAADLIKMAMLKIDQDFKKRAFKGYMILQVHDELIFEMPDEELEEASVIIREAMESVFTLKIPLVVDIAIGKNWASC